MNGMQNPFEAVVETVQKDIKGEKPLLVMGTVVSVSSSGVTLRMDGESTGGKAFKYNTAVTFSAGDRVLCGRVSGTWIVICKI